MYLPRDSCRATIFFSRFDISSLWDTVNSRTMLWLWLLLVSKNGVKIPHRNSKYQNTYSMLHVSFNQFIVPSQFVVQIAVLIGFLYGNLNMLLRNQQHVKRPTSAIALHVFLWTSSNSSLIFSLITSSCLCVWMNVNVPTMLGATAHHLLWL